MNKVLGFGLPAMVAIGLIFSCATVDVAEKSSSSDEQELSSQSEAEVPGGVEYLSSSSLPSEIVLCDYLGICSLVSAEVCDLLGGVSVQSCGGGELWSSSSASPTSSSSPIEGRSSSEESEEPSTPSSNSEEPSSSSTGPTHTLTCLGLDMDGISGTAVVRPTVRCGDNILSSSDAIFTWRTGNCLSGQVKDESFSNPSAGFFFISAKAACGGELQERCCGDILISDGKSSSSGDAVLNCVLPSTGIAGVPINLVGAVTCNGSNVPANSVSWTNVTAAWFNNPTSGIKQNIMATASCGGLDKTANCGSISIEIRSSSSGGSTICGGRSGWCFYAPGNCHEMPTDDCCENGTLVSSQSACNNTTIRYCNWGRCEGGRDWDCVGGGGCYATSTTITESYCISNLGTLVSSCPAGTCPPSADYCAK